MTFSHWDLVWVIAAYHVICHAAEWAIRKFYAKRNGP